MHDVICTHMCMYVRRYVQHQHLMVKRNKIKPVSKPTFYWSCPRSYSKIVMLRYLRFIWSIKYNDDLPTSEVQDKFMTSNFHPLLIYITTTASTCIKMKVMKTLAIVWLNCCMKDKTRVRKLFLKFWRCNH